MLRRKINQANATGLGRRTYGRVRTEDLESNLGRVDDLSLGGVKVVGGRRLDGEQQVTLRTLDGPLAVDGRVAWSKRIGFRKHAAGIEFKPVNDDVAQRLTEVSVGYRVTG